MKKIAMIGIVLLFILCGCNANKSIEMKKVDDFYTAIKERYTFIGNSVMYKRGGSNTLVVEYSSEIDVKELEVAKCFEATRKWLIEEGYLREIQSYLAEDIKTVDIRFYLPNKEEIYIAHYDKETPYGDDGNENNVDGFSKWQHEVVEKQDK